MYEQTFHKTGTLARFIIRRDRLRIPIWVLSFLMVTLMVAYSFTDLYSNEQERQAIAETMKNPAMTAMVGKGYGIENYTIGAMMAHQMFLLTAIVVAIMSILFVGRHTRADEEIGRIELIRSLPTGRLSNVTATLLVITCIHVILALFIGFSLYALQIESIDLEGSLLYGASLGAIGIFFAAVTTVFAQVSESARSTIGLSFAVLGGAYLLRAVGDVGNEWLSWMSPLGWMLHTEVYVNNHWWPIFLLLGVTVILMWMSFYLQAIRDIGSGLFPAKRGRTKAHPFIFHPFGFAFTLQRTGIIAWLIGMFILGISYGSVLGDLESFFTDNEMMQQLLQQVSGSSLTEQFIAMLMSIMAMICTVPAIIVLVKIKGEEQHERLEHFFSRAISRKKVFGGYVLLAYVVGLLALLFSVVGLWIAGVLVMEDMMAFKTISKAAIVYLPAMWIMISIAAFLIGMAPVWTGFTWVYLGYSFVIVYVGGLLQIPEWMEMSSPFGYIPQVPLEEIKMWSMLLLTGIACVITWIGFVCFQKRDVQG